VHRRLTWFHRRQQIRAKFFRGDAIPENTSMNGLSISVTANRGGNGAGLGFWWGRASGGRRRAWVVDPSDYPHLGCPILPKRRLRQPVALSITGQFCESMAPPGGRYASECSLGAKIRTKPTFDSGWDALRNVGSGSRRSIQMTASSFRAPRCSAAKR